MKTITINVNQKQLDMIKQLLNLEDDVTDSFVVQEFIIENTRIDEDGDEF
jgi:hypothetical protein